MGKDLLLQDNNLIETGTLPAGATSTQTTSLDTRTGPFGTFVPERVEFLLSVPALTSTQLPNSDTITYNILQSVDGATWTTLYPGVLVQTGASSAGAAANTFNFRPPVGCSRYLAAQAVGVAGVAASGSSFTLSAQF